MKQRVACAAAVGLLFALCAQAHAATIGPDSFGYTASDTSTPFSFEDISGTGTGLGLADDGASTVALGFTFDFYGTSYSSVGVATNGLLTFGGTNPSDWTNEDLTGALTTDLPTIAPFWVDIDISGGKPDSTNDIYFDLDAKAGTFTVTWLAVTSYQGTNGTNSFQLRLTDLGGGNPEPPA